VLLGFLGVACGKGASSSPPDASFGSAVDAHISGRVDVGLGGDADGDSSAGAITVLATGQQGAYSIAVDSTSVYWNNYVVNGSVMKVALDGGDPVTLAATQTMPEFMTIDAASAYWASDDAVGKVPLGGGTTATLVSGRQGITGITVAGDYLYWAEAGLGEGAILKIPVDGGVAVTLASGQIDRLGISVFGSNVYFGGSSNIEDVPSDGGLPVLLTPADAGGVVQIAVNATHVYWTSSAGTLMTVPIDGGVPVALVLGRTGTWGAVIDSANIYWTEYRPDGIVASAPLTRIMSNPLFGGATTGGAIVTLASMQAGPFGIAIDDASVYWTNAIGGQVLKARKR